MKRSVRKLCRSTDGAVAPTVALSLVGLLVIGGVGFDYARLASMDSELQTAADQAALAAASQLDGESGACLRAAQAASSLLTNNTRFGNFDSTNGIKVNGSERGDLRRCRQDQVFFGLSQNRRDRVMLPPNTSK